MSLVISVATANQMQVPYIAMRDIYQVRERHSRMYSWTALVTSQLLVEIPLNVFAASLYFLCWYWTVGFPNSRGGFTYFMLGIWSPLYYTTISQAVGSMSPTPEIAALLFSFLFSFVLILYVPCLLCPLRASLTAQLPFLQQRRLAAVQPARVVAVDVPRFPVHLPNRGHPRPSCQRTAHPMLRCRARHDRAALGSLVRRLHGPVHVLRGRIPDESEFDGRVPVLCI